VTLKRTQQDGEAAEIQTAPRPPLIILCLIFILSFFVRFLFKFTSFFIVLKTPISPSVSLSNFSLLFILLGDKHLDLDATLYK
jgi:hypothetical protein